METINVDGLPEPVVRSLENLVVGLKAQFIATNGSDAHERLERMKRAAGSWADADDEEYESWLEETYRARKMERREPLA